MQKSLKLAMLLWTETVHKKINMCYRFTATVFLVNMTLCYKLLCLYFIEIVLNVVIPIFICYRINIFWLTAPHRWEVKTMNFFPQIKKLVQNEFSASMTKKNIWTKFKLCFMTQQSNTFCLPLVDSNNSILVYCHCHCYTKITINSLKTKRKNNILRVMKLCCIILHTIKRIWSAK